MKTPLVVTLAAALLTVAPRFSVAQAEEKVVPLLPDAPITQQHPASGIEFRSWQQGQPPVKLIRKEEGFCALTGVGGGFAGGAEEARVYVADDGYWYLGGKSMQSGVHAECVVVRYPVIPSTAPTADKRVVILAAAYSFGSQYADVTARVKQLLHEGKEFHADPDSLGTDPQPYWNKGLVIFCKIGGKRAVFSVGEGEPVSRQLLLEKARLVTDKAPRQAEN